MYFRFLHSQGGRLHIGSTTGQVLCFELWLPNGLTPSVLIANRRFLQSSANHLKWKSILPHCAASAGCLSLSFSFFRPSLCQCKSWASFLVANHLFNRGMMEKYHATLTGPPLLTFFLPLISTGTFPPSALSSPPSFFLFYRSHPHLGHLSRSA
ncbi:hypothetical protein GQ55_8G086400 [Panicum hallii var. hallii]|uniref:Uncharacterized protein n=1 Tax=Panicum hallii var. hallii TaxID=1504633 RepID=A0A2T7CM21_9POAL|nr:hypothetical protein GQ55_8G086400 [Panicum hallii var. hallii]